MKDWMRSLKGLNSAAISRVDLTGAAVEALNTRLEQQLEEIERLGDLYRDDGLVFTSGVGTLINPTNLRRCSFAPLLERPRFRRYASTTCATPARHCY